MRAVKHYLALALLLGLVCLLGTLLKAPRAPAMDERFLWAFIDYAFANDLILPAPEELHPIVHGYELKINERPASHDATTIHAYFINAAALASDQDAPLSFRSLAALVFNGGRAFGCQQVMFVDGSIMQRSLTDFLNGPSPDPHVVKDLAVSTSLSFWINFIFGHEFWHLKSEREGMVPPSAATQATEREVAGAISRAQACIHRNDTGEARSLYHRILAICPAHIVAMDHLANLERRGGRAGQAVDLLKRSLQLSPNNKVALQNLPLALRAVGNYREAIIAADALRAAEPESPEADYHGGCARIALQEFAQAEVHLLAAQRSYRAAHNGIVLEVDLILLGSALQQAEPTAIAQRLKDVRSDCVLMLMQESLCRLSDQQLSGYATQYFELLKKGQL